MKIAFLSELFYPSMAGCERRFFEIGKRLVKRGHEIHVFTIRLDGNSPKEETVEGMFVHRYALSRNYCAIPNSRPLNAVLKYSLLTSARLLRQDFDVFYCNQWPIFHSICARTIASPLIQEWCEVWVHSIKAMMLQEILKLAGDYHIAVSEFTKRRLIRLLRVKPNKVSVVVNGVDCSKFSKNSDDRTWGRLVYVGRLVPHKHVEMVIEAFRRVKEKAPDVELHVIGSGPCLSSIKDQAHGLDSCFIHGLLPEDEMMQIMRSSSAFVFPSEREGSGIAALEAMASGTPVITADFPDNATKELVDGKNGIVVTPTADAIAETALSLLHDEKSWRRMSQYARSYVEQYDWNRVVTKFEEVLRDVA